MKLEELKAFYAELSAYENKRAKEYSKDHIDLISYDNIQQHELNVFSYEYDVVTCVLVFHADNSISEYQDCMYENFDSMYYDDALEIKFNNLEEYKQSLIKMCDDSF